MLHGNNKDNKKIPKITLLYPGHDEKNHPCVFTYYHREIKIS